MHKIGLIFNGVWSHYAFATAAKYNEIFKLIYVYDLESDKLIELDALCIPFQSNHSAIAAKKEIIYDFLKEGKKVFIEGDSSANWLDAQWEDRPVNNYWWVKDPQNPPVSHTNYDHPLYAGLKPRHACWHTHGAYTKIPAKADIIQTNAADEIITWQTNEYGGTLLVTTLDPIVEHGIQQITHLDNYVDRLVEYLSGIKPEGKFEIDPAKYGIVKMEN